MAKRDHRKMAGVSLTGCQVCTGFEGLARHHIVPRKVTQCDDPENLAVLCASCHRKVHKRELDLGIFLTRSQSAKSVLLMGNVYAAWQLLYPSDSPKKVSH